MFTIETTDSVDYADDLHEVYAMTGAMADHAGYVQRYISGTTVVAYCSQKRCAGHLIARVFDHGKV